MIKYQISGRAPSVLKRAVLSRLEKAARGIPGPSKRGEWSVGVSFVTPESIRRLNRAYRGKNCPTDVLSFAVQESRKPWRTGQKSDAGEKELGDLVICPQVAAREAKRRGIDPAEELVRLLAHGTLHLVGMDHDTPKKEERMFRIQEKIVEETVG